MQGLNQILLDDYFKKAETFTKGAVDTVFGLTKWGLFFWWWWLLGTKEEGKEVEIKDEQSLINEMRGKDIQLVVYLPDKSKLDIHENKIQVNFPTEKINRYEIILITSKKPMISTPIVLCLESNGNVLYSVLAKIVKEKVLKVNESYELSIQVSFDTKAKVLGAKALLAYLKLGT